MISQSDINDMKMASTARDAINQARSRVTGGMATTVPAEGPRYAFETDSKRMPVFDQAGNIFLSGAISEGKAITVPEGAKTGSILEYQDQATGNYYYGKVVDSKDKNVEVKNISKEEVDKEQEADDKVKVFKVSNDDIKEVKDGGVMQSLMSLLDPSENVVFKLFTLLLVGDIFESESMTDIFMGVYIRILALAVILIIGLYVSSTFF